VILYDFSKSQLKHTKEGESFYEWPPGKIRRFTTMPSLCAQTPKKKTCEAIGSLWLRGGAAARGSGGERPGAHHGAIGGGFGVGGVSGEGVRWRLAVVTARRTAPVRGKARLSNARRTELQCDLGEVLRVPIGLESRQRHELGKGCSAAAAGARTPASWRLGLSNKRPEELLGILGQAGATRVGGASGRRVELDVGTTGGGNGGSVPWQCARRRV
jgi:hypothetical protein